MREIKDQTIEEFAGALSSKAAVPGGGGASALAGALGNALGQMVANLTVGKKRYADVEEEIWSLLREMEEIQKRFLFLADEDARVFAPLAAAYGLPAGTEEERAHKEAVMEENLLAASRVPMEIMEEAGNMIGILETLAEKGSRMAISDVGVGVQFLRTALTGAVMNVYINTRSMKDQVTAEELNRRADRLLAEGVSRCDAVYERVREGLRG